MLNLKWNIKYYYTTMLPFYRIIPHNHYLLKSLSNWILAIPSYSIMEYFLLTPCKTESPAFCKLKQRSFAQILTSSSFILLSFAMPSFQKFFFSTFPLRYKAEVAKLLDVYFKNLKSIIHALWRCVETEGLLTLRVRRGCIPQFIT